MWQSIGSHCMCGIRHKGYLRHLKTCEKFWSLERRFTVFTSEKGARNKML